MSLFGAIYSPKLLNPGTKHDAVSLALIMEGVIEELTALGLDNGGLITDNVRECAKWRRMLSQKHSEIAFLCCLAHQVNSLVRDVLKSDFTPVARKTTKIVNYLNAGSSTWFVHARRNLERLYGKDLAFNGLCDTQWTSIQACFASLTRVERGLRAFVTTSKMPVPPELEALSDPAFWSDLHECDSILEPLCNASYRLQRDENTLADAVVSFRNIYFAFATNGKFGHELVASVEKQWSMCKQPLFLLGFALHPAFRGQMKVVMDANPAVCSLVTDAVVY